MGLFKDIIKILKKHEITFIEKRDEVDDVVSFLFKPDDNSKWISGQHGIFTVKNPGVKANMTRPFSVASRQEDGVVLLSMRIPENPSVFKQELLKLRTGDTISMRGPIGPFVLDNSHKPVVFIAGGIGITPFRALLLEAVNSSEKRPEAIHLLYSDDRGSFTYKNEFDDLAKANSYIKTGYFTNRNEFNDSISKRVEEYKNGAYYYVSGPPAMIKSLKKSLKDKGIKGSNIKSELFFGYK